MTPSSDLLYIITNHLMHGSICYSKICRNLQMIVDITILNYDNDDILACKCLLAEFRKDEKSNHIICNNTQIA